MRRKLFTAAACAVATIGFAAPAQAVELVTNGGFETGNFSGWTLGGNTGFTFVSTSLPHSGTYDAQLGPVGSQGSLSQWLDTVAGATYNISFWLQHDGGTPNSFQAFFDGNPILLNLNNSGGFDYFNFTFTANGTAPTLLEFRYQQDPAYFRLDDVSVQGLRGSVPEPATWAMMLLGFGGIGLTMRRRRRPALAQIA